MRVSGSISTWTTPSTWSIFAPNRIRNLQRRNGCREHTAAIDPFTDRLVRLAVLVLRDDHYYWYSRIHHVALDGFGAMSMMNRTAEIYTAVVRDLPVPQR
ncbi:hypothetical protein ACETU7_03850 [Rhodococcus sp. 3Y1]